MREPDFELVVDAPAGPTTITCVRGCRLMWVERGINNSEVMLSPAVNDLRLNRGAHFNFLDRHRLQAVISLPRFNLRLLTHISPSPRYLRRWQWTETIVSDALFHGAYIS